jgi:hypothetical protein
MANWIVTSDFLTPSAVIVASTATKYRANDLLLDTKPFRVWRSTDLTSESITWDFGSAVTVAGVYLNNANFASGTWTAGTTSAASDDTLGTRSVYAEELVTRRKALHKLTMATPRRFLRWTPASVVGADTFYELGAATFVTAAGMTPIGYSYGFPEWGQAQPLEYLDVASQVAVRGRPYLRLGLGQPHIRRGTSDADLIHFRTLIAKCKHTPHLFSANRDLDGDGTTRLAWLMIAEGEEHAHVETKVTFSPQTFVVREVVE